MDEQTRTAVTAAAVAAVGSVDDFDDPADFWAQVQEAAFGIMDAASERGRIGSQLELMSQARCYVVDEVLGVSKETSSQRVLVEMAVSRSKYNKDGVETIRTERLDSWQQGANARMVGHRAKALVGRAARVWVRNEEMADGSGNKVKVLMFIADAGKARSGERHVS